LQVAEWHAPNFAINRHGNKTSVSAACTFENN
ncbi:hypothetical protein T4D_12815, partial [Trichinella pseudospiralis]